MYRPLMAPMAVATQSKLRMNVPLTVPSPIAEQRSPTEFPYAPRLNQRESLGGGFNPFQKYAHQIGSFPQVGMKTKKIETINENHDKKTVFYLLPLWKSYKPGLVGGWIIPRRTCGQLRGETKPFITTLSRSGGDKN